MFVYFSYGIGGRILESLLGAVTGLYAGCAMQLCMRHACMLLIAACRVPACV